MDPGDFLSDRLNLPQDCPVDLQSVRDSLDPDGKPNQPLQLLVQLAIYGSPRKKLTLQEIYSALKERFPYFRNRPDVAWQVRLGELVDLVCR